MTLLESALHLATEYGLRVFPCAPNSKLPAIKKYTEEATTDPKKIRLWWERNSNYNIGISTGVESGIIAVDVDMSEGKDGEASVLEKELEGKDFPPTLEQRTPRGGRHLIYRCHENLRQGVSVLGRHVDLRASGGYIVGAGSRAEGGAYTLVPRSIAKCPQWVIEDRRGESGSESLPALPAKSEPRGVDRVWAFSRAIPFLREEAKPAISGEGGDQTTFQVAAKLRDFGVAEDEAIILMLNHYNPRCVPPWSASDITTKVQNAYRYGENAPALLNPAAQFDIIPTPPEPETVEEAIERLNENFAFVLIGGTHRIIYESKGKVELLKENTFDQMLASDKVCVPRGDKTIVLPTSKAWMIHPSRRSYRGMVFAPGGPKEVEGEYNLWRGNACEPYATAEEATDSDRKAVAMWREHNLETICAGDKEHAAWVEGFFAQMLQKPMEKPLCALVLKGGKGTGKSSFVDCVGVGLGEHYKVASNERYLRGNFNAHLETNLLFVLEELFWAGDKSAEGILKDLITGRTHNIERKGVEVRTVRNYSRVVVIGNDEWLVPASSDERRFAVFDLGPAPSEEEKDDQNAFFQEMRERMEAGGRRLLYRYLLDFNLKSVNLNRAPETVALQHQKLESMSLLDQFFFELVKTGKYTALGFTWPEKESLAVDSDVLYSMARHYYDSRGSKQWVPSRVKLGARIRNLFSDPQTYRNRNDEGSFVTVYNLPPLEKARELARKSFKIS